MGKNIPFLQRCDRVICIFNHIYPVGIIHTYNLIVLCTFRYDDRIVTVYGKIVGCILIQIQNLFLIKIICCFG